MSADVVPIGTPDGVFTATFSERGLVALDFPKPSERRSAPRLPDVTDTLALWGKLTESALREVLAGRQPPTLPPLDFSSGTPFQQRVWKVLLTIPVGRTFSYGEVANKVGEPKATRAVGSACGANRIPLLVPCHRVLAKGGQIGGFSAGLRWKRLLLEREGVQLAGE